MLLLLTVNRDAGCVHTLSRLIVALVDPTKSAWTSLRQFLLFHKCCKFLLMEPFQFGHVELVVGVGDQSSWEDVSSLLLLLLGKLVRVDSGRCQSFNVTASSVLSIERRVIHQRGSALKLNHAIVSLQGCQGVFS